MLCNDLFDPAWTVRHGAALALREIVKWHAAGAGRTVGASAREQEVSPCRAFGHARARVCVRVPCVPCVQCARARGSLLHCLCGSLTAQEANQVWREDTILRLLCVLALDRFGDYVSDQVGLTARTPAAHSPLAVIHG